MYKLHLLVLFLVNILIFYSVATKAFIKQYEETIDYNICDKVCKNESSSYLQEYCDTHTLVLQMDHCCQNKTNSTDTVIGIDLRGCNITDVRQAIIPFVNSLIIISLEDNPITSASKSDYHGLTDLKYLSLPPSLSCPGGERSWQSIETFNTSIKCHNQIDLCLQEDVKCPKNSICVNTGPGYYECDCLSGHYGYKCLRKGKFPTIIFGIGFAATTVGLSIILWLFQRRHIKKIS